MESSRLKCPVQGCSHSYKIEKTLKRHLKAYHSGEPRYRCHVCTRTLSSKQNLAEHISIHTGDKHYKCTEPGCGLTFRQGSQLTTHKKIHSLVASGRRERINHELSVSFRQLSSLWRSESLYDIQYKREPPLFTEREIILPKIRHQRSYERIPSLPEEP